MELVEESYHIEDCSVKPNEAFTKFWKLKNTGKLLFCILTSMLLQYYMPKRTCVFFRFDMQIIFVEIYSSSRHNNPHSDLCWVFLQSLNCNPSHCTLSQYYRLIGTTCCSFEREILGDSVAVLNLILYKFSGFVVLNRG